jgi:hypothetical protein
MTATARLIGEMPGVKLQRVRGWGPAPPEADQTAKGNLAAWLTGP